MTKEKKEKNQKKEEKGPKIKLTEIIDGLYADGLISNGVKQQILEDSKTVEKIQLRLEKSTQIVCMHYRGCFCNSCKLHKKIVADCKKLLGINGRFKRNDL